MNDLGTCKMPGVMVAWHNLDELYEDFKDLSDSDLRKLRKTMKERVATAMGSLNEACDITDEDAQYWTGE